MSRALAARQELVLKIVVQEYISKATPVASETLVRNYRLGVSPATVRNYMSRLEEEGYLSRPHTSAGSIPLGKAYRRYVESLANNLDLSPAEKRVINKLFEEAGDNAEEWIKLAAAMLARVARNVAVVTEPKALSASLKHVELVGVSDNVALLIIILPEIRLKQQLIYFPERVGQDELSRIANKLNDNYALLTSAEIARTKLKLTPPEAQVLNAIINVMSEQDRNPSGRPYFEGMRLMLNQPEFLPTERMLSVMDLIENMEWLGTIVSKQPKDGSVQVVIGEESQQDALRDLSMVFTGYGVPDAIGGTIGILGPTRMDYAHSIAAVRYLARLLSNLFAGLYHHE